jgi:TetR/AcrR family transcriptional regulator, cholesterol catabolism regulator
MEDQFRKILEKTRELSLKYSLRGYTMERLCKLLEIPVETLLKYVKNESELVEKALEFERDSFKNIFDTNDFEGVNAIDILFTVSKELSFRFKDINPSLTFDLKKYYPEIYQKHIEDKYDFIFNKIKINIQKGISQGMYRDDLSVELVARLYLARLMDIHNPDLFPPDKYSFELVFDYTIENFVRSIAKPDGLAYFEHKKSHHLI